MAERNIKDMNTGILKQTQYEVAIKRRIRISTIIIIFVVPLLIGLGVVLGQRWYLAISVLILIAIMAPFFMIFEKRKPKAREIVLIAMMSAIVVTGHLIFHLVLPIHIGTALVVIAGIGLGPEAGFLIGALSRFICNFYMGQGAWTPWQMFCWGLLGFLAGLAFNRDNIKEAIETKNSNIFRVVMGPTLAIAFSEIVAYLTILFIPSDEGGYQWRFYFFGAIGLVIGTVLQKKRLPVSGITMALFTFVTTFVIYGGIMNIAALITSMSLPGASVTGINLTAIKTIYITGLPYDLLHGLTAAICVFFFGEPMIQKLERIKIKYGIYK